MPRTSRMNYRIGKLGGVGRNGAVEMVARVCNQNHGVYFQAWPVEEFRAEKADVLRDL